MDQVLQPDLTSRQQQSLYRQRNIIDGPQQIHLNIAGRTFLSFSSNDYLGLANHPDIIHQFKKGVNQYGVGSGAAHLVSGHSRVHHLLEEELAEFTGRSRALLFSTGYMANLGIATALAGKHDFIFQDKLNHASLIDAARLSRARLIRYVHNDMQMLSRLLAREADAANGAAKGDPTRQLIMSDAVFSMDGDIAEVNQMSQICQQHNAWMMLDDAHGFGVLGETGAGTAQACGLDQQQLPVYMATLGKAMGVFGAFVAGSETLIETLIQQSRPYIYTTAMPAALAQALRESLRITRNESWRREKLNTLIQRFKQGAKQLGLPLMESMTPIQPILVGDSEKALQMSQMLEKLGILITAIRPPTVPQHTARLRITFSAAHQEADIDRLLMALEKML
jgi:8-amino-7-oxononanoate synthase